MILQNPMEAQFLANQVQLYYTTSDQGRFTLVRRFNQSPETFDYQDLIEHLQSSDAEPRSEELPS